MALVLVLGLCALEVVTSREALPPVEGLRHLRELPGAGRGARATRRDAHRDRRQLDHARGHRHGRAHRQPPGARRRTTADLFYADHSYINTWQFILQRHFWTPGNRVDLVVIPFWGTNLYDGNELEIGRLAQFFTSVRDWPTVLDVDLGTTAERADFLVSSLWATFAARDRMREWAFTTALPDYKGYASREQDVITTRMVNAAAGKPKKARTTEALARLLESARAHDTRLVFMAFPTRHDEWNDRYEEPVRLMEEAGMHYVDLRDVDVVDDDSYVDLVHMNADGRSAFTRRLAESLLPIVLCDDPDCRVQAAAARPLDDHRIVVE